MHSLLFHKFAEKARRAFLPALSARQHGLQKLTEKILEELLFPHRDDLRHDACQQFPRAGLHTAQHCRLRHQEHGPVGKASRRLRALQKARHLPRNVLRNAAEGALLIPAVSQGCLHPQSKILRKAPAAGKMVPDHSLRLRSLLPEYRHRDGKPEGSRDKADLSVVPSFMEPGNVDHKAEHRASAPQGFRRHRLLRKPDKGAFRLHGQETVAGADHRQGDAPLRVLRKITEFQPRRLRPHQRRLLRPRRHQELLHGGRTVRAGPERVIERPEPQVLHEGCAYKITVAENAKRRFRIGLRYVCKVFN